MSSPRNSESSPPAMSQVLTTATFATIAARSAGQQATVPVESNQTKAHRDLPTPGVVCGFQHLPGKRSCNTLLDRRHSVIDFRVRAYVRVGVGVSVGVGVGVGVFSGERILHLPRCLVS